MPRKLLGSLFVVTFELLLAGTALAQIYVLTGVDGGVNDYSFSGNVIQTNLVQEDFPTAMALSGNLLYLAYEPRNANSDTVSVYNATTGVVINNSLITGLACIDMAVSGNYLYVETNGGTIDIYNATTGAYIAEIDRGQYSTEGFSIGGNVVYAVEEAYSNFAYTIYAFNATTGAQIGSGPLISGLNGPGRPAISGNILYVENQGPVVNGYYSPGTIGTYNATTGAPINASLITGLQSPKYLTVIGNNIYVAVINSNNKQVLEEFTTGGVLLSSNIILSDLESIDFEIASGASLTAPAITSASNASFILGQANRFTFTATGNPAPTFSSTGLPSWASLNATTGVLSGTPTNSTGSSFTLTVTAFDGTAPNATQTFTLNVVQAPSITSANSTTFTMSQAGSFTVTAAGRPAPTFSATGLPSWASLNAMTGVLGGIPPDTTGSPFTINLTAANGASPNATQVFTLNVQPPETPPAITSSSVATFAVGQSGRYAVTATGSPAPTFSAMGLPSWVSLNSTTGVLSGTPPDNTGAPFTINLAAANGNSPNASMVLTLNVQPLATFSEWEASNSFTGDSSIIGPADTPWNDGVPNLLKYFYDINPTVPMNTLDRAALPVLETTTTDGTQYLTLTFRENALETGITINLQTSLDLQTWTTVTPNIDQQTGTDPNSGDPIIEMGVIATGSKRFIRLQVISP